MAPELESMVRELHDKMKIREVVTNYCRGVDRMDKDLLFSCYHPDAIDDHGFFVGDREAFWAFVNRYHNNAQATHQHIITNHSCTLEGNTAHTESYWLFAAIDAKDFSLSLGGGRYIDRMEKRNGEWRIAARKCIAEWGGVPTQGKVPPEALAMLRSNAIQSRDRKDCSYDRPLTVDPARVGLNIDALPPEYHPAQG